MPPLRWSALASSSAKKGLPPEVSQSLISVGRGNVASRRARSSSWSAPDAQAADLDRSQPLLGHGAPKPGRHVAADRQQGGDRLVLEAGERVAKRRERRRVQPLDVVDREAERDCRRRAGAALRGTRRPPRGHRRGSPTRRAAARPRAPAAGSAAARARTSPAASPRRSASPANENWVSASEGREDRTR